MWELDYKEIWVPKNWYFWTVVLEKTPESPLDCKESKEVNPKGNQSWIFIGRTDAEFETPVLWLPDVTNWYFKRPWCWKKIVGGRRRGLQRMRWLDGIIDSMEWVWETSGSWWWTGKPGVLQSMWSQIVGHNWTSELDWTELNPIIPPSATDFLVHQNFCCSVATSSLTLCDLVDCNIPGFPVPHYHFEFAQVLVHWMGDTIQPSHALLPSSSSAIKLSQFQVFFLIFSTKEFV